MDPFFAWCRNHVRDIRLSDSLTVEHNTLGPGVIGHIMRNRTWDAGTLARTDRWFHYDQVGTVISTTDADGAAVDMNWFDAFGNRLENWETGLVASGGGWGLHSKNRDPLAAMHYMSQRWYAADLGVFASASPLLPMVENDYTFVLQRPHMFVDPTGLTVLAAGINVDLAGPGGGGGIQMGYCWDSTTGVVAPYITRYGGGTVTTGTASVTGALNIAPSMAQFAGISLVTGGSAGAGPTIGGSIATNASGLSACILAGLGVGAKGSGGAVVSDTIVGFNPYQTAGEFAADQLYSSNVEVVPPEGRWDIWEVMAFQR